VTQKEVVGVIQVLCLVHQHQCILVHGVVLIVHGMIDRVFLINHHAIPDTLLQYGHLQCQGSYREVRDGPAMANRVHPGADGEPVGAAPFTVSGKAFGAETVPGLVQLVGVHLGVAQQSQPEGVYGVHLDVVSIVIQYGSETLSHLTARLLIELKEKNRYVPTQSY
jgi:hypothetical protein